VRTRQDVFDKAAKQLLSARQIKNLAGPSSLPPPADWKDQYISQIKKALVSLNPSLLKGEGRLGELL
jgi:hypothetical protein